MGLEAGSFAAYPGVFVGAAYDMIAGGSLDTHVGPHDRAVLHTLFPFAGVGYEARLGAFAMHLGFAGRYGRGEPKAFAAAVPVWDYEVAVSLRYVLASP